jgi:hypothetical protein
MEISNKTKQAVHTVASAAALGALRKVDIYLLLTKATQDMGLISDIAPDQNYLGRM